MNLGFRNTHLPLPHRARLAIAREKVEQRNSRLSPERWAEYWRHIRLALHVRSNVARLAESQGIDLHWFEQLFSDVFGPEWYRRTPCTSDQTVRSLHHLIRSAVEHERSAAECLPSPGPVAEFEVDRCVEEYLRTHPPRSEQGWARRLRWQFENGTIEGAKAVLLAAAAAAGRDQLDGMGVIRFGLHLLQQLPAAG